MTKHFFALVLSLSLLLPLTLRATAQTDTPPGRTGTVIGQIANGTAGGEVPGDLPVMLHAWDADGETVMLDGKADAFGKFGFDNVPMQDGWIFAAMMAYNEVTFFSKPGEVRPETEALTLPLTVYETTSDASAVSVSQVHVFLDFDPGKVIVGEIYVLSNTGDRAVVGGLTLPDGKTATLQFALPAEANEVKFPGEDAARFVITPEGFADVGAVTPGRGTAQVVVSYTLPYTSGMTISHAVSQQVEAVNVLMRPDAGVLVAGDGLSEPTPRQLQTGETFNVYVAPSLSPGNSLRITLTGEPATYRQAEGTTGAMDEPSAFANRWGLPVAGGVLGLALIGVGLWWWRRSSERGEAEDEPQAEWWDTLRAIAALDEAHEQSKVSDGEYRARRTKLMAQARAVLQEMEPTSRKPEASTVNRH